MCGAPGRSELAQKPKPDLQQRIDGYLDTVWDIVDRVMA